MNKNNINDLISQSCCFDLQFRKDVRRERTNSPTYYRWKAQFIITAPKSEKESLNKIKKIIGCGNVYSEKNQARFSVQKIDDIVDFIIPYFSKNRLNGKKNNEFQMWKKSAEIIYKNKGKYIAKWDKNDILSLIEIHKSNSKYKNNSRQSKWLKDNIKTIIDSIKKPQN